MDFKVGDRVVTIRDDYGHGAGDHGVVVLVRRNSLAVRFDEFSDKRHSLSGECTEGHGWNCEPDYLQHAEPQNTSVSKRREW